MTTKRLISIVLPWLLIVVVGLLSSWLRYDFIEPAGLAHLCDEGLSNRPASCGFRHFVVLGFNSYGFGIAALIATALALMLKKPAVAWLAAAIGLFALTLYCYYAGAIALLVGCLRLVRLQANRMPAPRNQYGHGNRQVKA
ncbi:hypothetical protein [Dyella mobilis]|uniref:Vitamin K epoxide reductase family protein n=1 Tax=Dyella mobilis TaxID=1849582 RepID=A0ABS2KBM0_9GAMM|nr:hypothetical protein [Dyella mobilis]MBM7128580.1 hypothetical protein [Dyella mobilis]GLQ99517.1 hypothetical protein GCM10007863_39370 [Dyella mobilis]